MSALMSIGVSGQAAVSSSDSESLFDQDIYADYLVQHESNNAENQVHFSTMHESEGVIKGFLSLDLKNIYKKLYINFDFDSEILNPCTDWGVCDADQVSWKIHRRPKRLNNYTIEIDPAERNYITIAFTFKGPFNMPKNVFVSDRSHPIDGVWESLHAFWSSITKSRPRLMETGGDFSRYQHLIPRPRS